MSKTNLLIPKFRFNLLFWSKLKKDFWFVQYTTTVHGQTRVTHKKITPKIFTHFAILVYFDCPYSDYVYKIAQ